MKKLGFALLALAAALAAPAALAEGLTVTNAWSRSTPPGAKVGVVYFTLKNDTKKSDRLLKLSAPVAEKIEVHRTEVLDGIARMREVAVLQQVIEVEHCAGFPGVRRVANLRCIADGAVISCRDVNLSPAI